MDYLHLSLIVIFVTINIIQTWLIFTLKSIIKGGVIIGVLEAVEFPLMIYLIIKGGVIWFAIVVLVEITQWLLIAYFATNSKIR